MKGGDELAEFAPLVGRVSPVQDRKLRKGPAVAIAVAVACVCLVAAGALSNSSPTALLDSDPRMGGMDGLGILGARQRIEIPASAQQLRAVDQMADVREMNNGRLGYIPRQAARGSVWSGLDDSVGRLPGVNVDAWGAMKHEDGVETPVMLRRTSHLHQYHPMQAGGALSRLPSEHSPDVLERIEERPVVAVPVVEERPVYEEGVLARAPMTGEGVGLLGRVRVVDREAGGALLQAGDDPATAEGALAETGEDDAATEGVLSGNFGLDPENTGGSLFMQSVQPDEGWMQSGKDDGWASEVHDDSWKLDTSKTASGSLAMVKGDDMAQGALSTLSAQKLSTHKAAAAVVHKLHGGEDVKGSLSVSPTEHSKELVDGSLAATHNSYGHEGSLSRVKTIDEIAAEKAADKQVAMAHKATQMVHKIKGGEDVKGSLSVSPAVHAKELVDGSLAATAKMAEGAHKAAEGQGKKVVEEATMAAKIMHKLHEASQVAKKMTHVEQPKDKAEAKAEREQAKAAAGKSKAVVKEQEKDLQHLVKTTMKTIKKQAAPAAHAAAHIKAAHTDATGKALAKPKITLQAKKGFDLLPKEHHMNLLNETDGESADDLEGSWDDVGWVKHHWTLTSWVLFAITVLFTILVTALVGHTAGFVAALCTFIILFCMDIACYYYSWYLW